MTMRRTKDETNRRYGRLVVVSRAPSSNGRAAWHCVCDCGGTCVALGVRLRRGQTRTCGRRCPVGLFRNRPRNGPQTDETGNVYGRLTVRRPVRSDRLGWHWECDCQCGSATTVAGSRLRAGAVKTCGRSCPLMKQDMILRVKAARCRRIRSNVEDYRRRTEEARHE